MVNSVARLSSVADVSADESLSATNCVLERFHIDKFRELQQVAILNLLKGKSVLVSQPTASGKLVIFQSLPIIVKVVYGCNRWLSHNFKRNLWEKAPAEFYSMKPTVSDSGKNLNGLSEIFVVVDSKLILRYQCTPNDNLA